MSELSLEHTLGLQSANAVHFTEVLVRLVVATVLGALVAYRPWRALMPRAQPLGVETVQAQTLIASAGALMVVVIGDSVARAFGLVGLGAFIRFRSGIKDPRDAAVMFVMIGVGMACGMGLVPLAVVAALFAASVLALLDLTTRQRSQKLRVGVDLAHPLAWADRVRALFPGARVLELPSSETEGRLLLELDTAESLDAAQLTSRLREGQIEGVRAVAVLLD